MSFVVLNDVPSEHKPFRVWVQDVYKFTGDKDTRRIIAGTVSSGTVTVGDTIMFHLSGKKTGVQTIEAFNAPELKVAFAGMASGFTLSEQIYVARGELATRTDEAKPCVSSRLRVSLFWLSREPMVEGKRYTLKIGTARVGCRIETIHHVQDGSSLGIKKASAIGRHEIADCDLQLERAIAFDLAEDIAATGRFVIVDEFEIRGGGTVREALEDRQSAIRERVLVRDYRWETSTISAEERAARFGQKPALVLITGAKDSSKKPLARSLESRLLAQGHLAYFLGIGNILYGVDADIKGRSDDRREHIRKLAEVAHIILGAGFILVVTAIDLREDELDLMRSTVDDDQIVIVWRGGATAELTQVDVLLGAGETLEVATSRVLTSLIERGILPLRAQE